MSELYYDLKDLKVVIIDENYMTEDECKYINSNYKYIVEKIDIEGTDRYGFKYYAEYYTECITEKDLNFRLAHKKYDDFPKKFLSVLDIPLEYLNEEEIESGKISKSRICKIFEDMNMNIEISPKKVKRLKKNKKN